MRIGSPVWMPIRTRTAPTGACWIASAAATACPGSTNAIENSSPSSCTSRVEPSMSVNRRVTLIPPSLRSDGVADERAAGAALCRVGIRMLEDVHRVPRPGLQLEPVAVAPVVDRDAQAVRAAVPEQRDCDSVVLPICEFILHDSSLMGCCQLRGRDVPAKCG